MTSLLQNTLEKDDSNLGTWNPKLLHTCTALRAIASDNLHSYEPAALNHAFNVLRRTPQEIYAAALNHAFNVLRRTPQKIYAAMGISKEGLGKDQDSSRKLMAL